MMQRFALDERERFEAWLIATPRAIVLFRGVGCPYSATFEKAFLEEAPPAGWALAIRLVEEGGHGPIAEALGVDVTPTVAAFTEGAEAARLDGRLLLGIPRTSYRKWLRGLA